MKCSEELDKNDSIMNGKLLQKMANLFKKDTLYIICVLFKIDSLPKEICVLFHSRGISAVSFSIFLARFFYVNRIRTKMSHLFGFWCFFSTVLEGPELALTRKKEFKLFVVHKALIFYKAFFISKALIYSSGTEGKHPSHLVKMPHTLSIA